MSLSARNFVPARYGGATIEFFKRTRNFVPARKLPLNFVRARRRAGVMRQCYNVRILLHNRLYMYIPKKQSNNLNPVINVTMDDFYPWDIENSYPSDSELDDSFSRNVWSYRVSLNKVSFPPNHPPSNKIFKGYPLIRSAYTIHRWDDHRQAISVCDSCREKIVSNRPKRLLDHIRRRKNIDYESREDILSSYGGKSFSAEDAANLRRNLKLASKVVENSALFPNKMEQTVFFHFVLLFPVLFHSVPFCSILFRFVPFSFHLPCSCSILFHSVPFLFRFSSFCSQKFESRGDSSQF